MRGQAAPGNTLVASAYHLSGIPHSVKPPSNSGAWQEALWSFYDTVGEYEFVINWLGSLLSRARLYAAIDGVEVKDGPAFDAVQELFISEQGRSEALRTMSLHRSVAGEFYVISHDAKKPSLSDSTWAILPPQRINKQGTVWTIDGKPVPGKPFVMRYSLPHPRLPDQVTSPSRAALPILNEIYRLTQHVDAQVSSRLASAGLLLMPNGMVVSSKNRTDAEGNVQNETGADAIVTELIETMKTAIVDRGDASALVPIVMTGEGEDLEKVRLLEFWTELDSHAMELRQEGIRRLGLALDVPPEILTGSADASHWQSWGVDDAAIKVHAEPALFDLCAALTEGYLWPALSEGLKQEELPRYSIMADTSAMRMRPNRSSEAIELHGLGELSGAALRRETGFDEQDAPDAEERKMFALRKLAGMAATPEMAGAALGELGIPLSFETDNTMRGEVPADVGADVPKRSAVPTETERRELEDDAERKRNEAALVAAAEQMVFRALERGGNRVASRLKHKPEGVDPAESYLFREWSDAEASFMLDGSFAQCDRFADRLGVTPVWLAATLESYCRTLIVNREPHTAERLARALLKERANA